MKNLDSVCVMARRIGTDRPLVREETGWMYVVVCVVVCGVYACASGCGGEEGKIEPPRRQGQERTIKVYIYLHSESRIKPNVLQITCAPVDRDLQVDINMGGFGVSAAVNLKCWIGVSGQLLY